MRGLFGRYLILRAAPVSLMLGLLWAITSPVSAREVEDVSLPETLTLSGVGAPLVLNGAGVRKRFFIKVYVGALYLPVKEASVEKILNSADAKSVRMHVLYGEIEAKKLADAWTEGVKANQDKTEFETLAARLAVFNAMFRTVRRGDVMRIDLLPNGDTRVTINEEPRGTVTGADFQRALLKIWLGDNPADNDLKRAMLGEKE
jgi:hypothetical protein